MYAPQLGRFISRDPIGYVDGVDTRQDQHLNPDGPNVYQYVRSRPISLVDPKGLEAFELNRKLGAKAGEKDIVKANCNPLSHTFVYTAHQVTEDVFDPTTGNDLGTVTHWVLDHTYSWGNTAGMTTWHADQPEDITAAQQAINSNYMGVQFGPDDVNFNKAVDQAFANLLSSAGQKHWNLFISCNCKEESGELEDEADRVWRYKKF